MLPRQTSPSGRKQRGSGPSRRGEILLAAKRLFLTEGFERTTIRKIAAAVGVSSGALYLYFPDKDAIMRGIAEETFGALLVQLEAARNGPGDTLARLRTGMLTYIVFGRAHPDEYRLTFLSKMMGASMPGRTGDPCRELDVADRSFDILLQETTSLIEAGIFRAIDPCEAAEALWACLHGATALLLDHTEHLDTPGDRLAERVVDIALKGMCRQQTDH
jgi:AcrR family transcriptional regulator